MKAVSSLKIRISITTPTNNMAIAHNTMTIAVECANARSPILSNFATNKGRVKPNTDNRSAHCGGFTRDRRFPKSRMPNHLVGIDDSSGLFRK